MKVVIQRVKEAKVEVENKVVGKIEKGFLVFLGITHTDTKEQADYLVKKLCNLRVFTDREGKMNLGLKEVVNRPSFTEAAKPEQANKLYEYFCSECEKNNIKVERGIFGADMQVSLINDGPVTIVIEK